ncbi:Ppx/GppA phosphatase family protein [Fodinibius saliphilus]|uniref:Ppx/GppA phosphatase family protein n=1 Tax=Fodinibius saliphilus TaxID=1920650 RepID=UPI00110862C8|nr:Ppx/GppA phosphatase family protein [Fodinibius saliphilus]
MRASIDIGTNTVLLLVAKVSDGELKVVNEQQRVPRLGEGVDKERNLSEKAIRRVIDALIYFRKVLKENYPSVKTIKVTATSAVRDANNRNEFIKQVKQEAGFEVSVLNGYEEAQFTFWGSQSVLTVEKPIAVIDIGGGSTEIAVGSPAEGLTDRHSFNMGCVRFTERYLFANPPNRNQIEDCRTEIKNVLINRPFSFAEGTKLVGVAGTVTSLVYMELGLRSYNAEALNEYQLEVATLRKWIAYIQQQNSSELIDEYPEVMKGRADIFLAGLLILEQTMELYNFDRLLVSTGGIRHGAILKSMENKKGRPE